MTVDHAVITTAVMLRSWLGSELRIVILSMTDQDRRERTLARHAGDQTSADTLDVGLPSLSDVKGAQLTIDKFLQRAVSSQTEIYTQSQSLRRTCHRQST